MKKLKLAMLLAISCLIWSCQDDETPVVENPSSDSYSNYVPMMWNHMFLDVARYTAGYRPPVTARAVAYINLSAYEVTVHGSGGSAQSMSQVFPGMELSQPDLGLEYNWEVAANAAYEKSFSHFFHTAPSNQQFHMLDLASNMRSKFLTACSPEVFQRSVDFGRQIAQEVYEWSKKDEKGHESNLHNVDPSYTPPQGFGFWQPTFPDYAPALLPYWGEVRTFAATQAEYAPAPPVYQTTPGYIYAMQAQETYDLVNEIRAGNKEEDKWIAEFWSDDCPAITFDPAARWVSIANQVLAIEQLDLMASIQMFTQLGMAIHDAGVVCWGAKFKYNILRPIDFIRNEMQDLEWNTIMCPDASGRFYTPNFPTYPSGHATFGAAAAIVLEENFGTNYRFTDRSHADRSEFNGAPRTFDSFREAAEENAYSRIPLGVHFRMDSDAGTASGYQVGDRVMSLPW